MLRTNVNPVAVDALRTEDRNRQAGGPGWPLRPAEMHPEPLGTFRETVCSRGAVSWFVGGACSLFWLLSVGGDLVRRTTSAGFLAVGIALLVVYAAAFLLAVPLMWSLPARWRLAPAGAVFALSFALVPWIGWEVRGLWTYVGVLIGMAVMRWSTTWTLLLVLGAASWVFGALADGADHADLWLPAITISISAMMAAFARNIAAINQLRAVQAQVAALAAERERGRLARDLHDILGHSLTVIAVKTELARALIDTDPERARREITDVEELARGALADVRSTVNAARSVSIASELVGARRGLEAAGIAADVPGSTDAVPADQRELAGWVVREGVTNVVRHSGATRCRVTLDAHSVEVADNGRGPSSEAGGGLTGLRERVEASGARMTFGRAPEGGFLLRVTW